MTRVLHVDAFAGLGGDMFVAALVHLGAPLDGVIAGVRSLGVPGWDARIERVTRGAYAASRFVVYPTDAPARTHGHGHGHDHAHAHGHDHAHAHGHDHAHAHGHDQGHPGDDAFPGQPSRAWRDIRALLEAASLPERARARALRVFALLAEAEGRVHGMPAEEVTFHEVGAVDSIVDIVAACVALELLDVAHLTCTALPMGSGTVRSAHGILPVPVPATVEVLRGFPVVPSDLPGELVTPTGAALMAGLATPGPIPPMTVLGVGYGAGTRDPATHANVLRVILGSGSAQSATDVVELRAQVDDLTGESVPGVIQALLDAGALDAWASNVWMKKGRPGLLIEAICAVDDREAVGEALLRHAGTLGYRWSPTPREVCGRERIDVATAFGNVRVKVATRHGRVIHAAPEHEDCAALARDFDVPVARVRGAALAAWASKQGHDSLAP